MNGGAMIGNVAVTLKNRFQGISTLVTAYAKMKPMTVLRIDTATPRFRLWISGCTL